MPTPVHPHPSPSGEVAPVVERQRPARAWQEPRRALALLDRLRDAVEAVRRDTEREVQVQFDIDPALLPTRLRPAVRQHAYLIGKESLTNALKHGARSGVLAVALHVGPAVLRLVVENDAPGGAVGRSGQGLRNMAARAAAIGGTLHLATLPDGRWQVLLHVPRPLA